MAKKIIITFLLVLIACIAAFFIWSFVNYKRDKDPGKLFLLPRLELSVVDINSLTTDRTDMVLKVHVKNNLPFRLKADSLAYRIFINGVEIVKDRYKKSISLERNNSDWISLPVTIFNNHIQKILKASKLKGVDSVEYRLQASFYTTIIFNKKFNIDVKRVLPLIYIPELEVEHMKVDSLNFKRAAIDIVLKIKNQNVFAIKAKDITYQISIEDNKWIEGVIPGLTDIKAQDKTSLEIPLHLSFKEVGKTLFDLLKKGENVKYKLHVTLRIDSENQIMKNSKVILKSLGTVKSLIKMIKNKNK